MPCESITFTRALKGTEASCSFSNTTLLRKFMEAELLLSPPTHSLTPHPWVAMPSVCSVRRAALRECSGETKRSTQTGVPLGRGCPWDRGALETGLEEQIQFQQIET